MWPRGRSRSTLVTDFTGGKIFHGICRKLVPSCLWSEQKRWSKRPLRLRWVELFIEMTLLTHKKHLLIVFLWSSAGFIKKLVLRTWSLTSWSPLVPRLLPPPPCLAPRLRRSCWSRSSWSAASRKCWRRRTRIGSSPRATSTTRAWGSCSSSSTVCRSAITTATWRKWRWVGRRTITRIYDFSSSLSEAFQAGLGKSCDTSGSKVDLEAGVGTEAWSV